MTRVEIESQLRAENPSTTDDAGLRHYPGSPFYEAKIEEWADAMEAAQVPPVPEGRKIWPSADKFLAEFSTPEDPFSILSAISLSTDPAVAALRLVLTTHPGEVWSDDPRVVLGMAALVAAEIIDEQMSASILDPAPAPAEN